MIKVIKYQRPLPVDAAIPTPRKQAHNSVGIIRPDAQMSTIRWDQTKQKWKPKGNDNIQRGKIMMLTSPFANETSGIHIHKS
jgi:hypothetical protein